MLNKKSSYQTVELLAKLSIEIYLNLDLPKLIVNAVYREQIMNHQVFVPVTDDIIYNHPEQIEGPLVPYFAGMECQNWLSIEINPDESEEIVISERSSENAKSDKPKLHLAYSA